VGSPRIDVEEGGVRAQLESRAREPIVFRSADDIQAQRGGGKLGPTGVAWTAVERKGKDRAHARAEGEQGINNQRNWSVDHVNVPSEKVVDRSAATAVIDAASIRHLSRVGAIESLTINFLDNYPVGIVYLHSIFQCLTARYPMSRQLSLAQSNPASLRTFSDLLAARAETVTQIAEDILVHSDVQRQQLQQSLQGLVFQINTVQSEFSTDQRGCLVERERLATELARLKVAEETRRKEATVAHLSRLGEARAGHAQAIAQLNRVVPPEREPPSFRHSTPTIDEARETLREFEQSLRSLRHSSAEEPATEVPSDGLTESVTESRRERDVIAGEVKLSSSENQKKLVTMVVALDDQAVDHQKEIAEFERTSASREKEYEGELKQLLSQVATVQQRRWTADEQRRKAMAAIETEIASGQSDFDGKMRDARQLAERLRARLANAKLRKDEGLRGERQRSDDRTRLVQENSDLRIKATQLEGDIALAKEVLAGLRRELTATVGPRRTQSLFI
jgi:hypothetical protein